MEKKHLIIFVPTDVEKKYLKDSLKSLESTLSFSYKLVVTGFGKVNASQYCALETQSQCDAVVSCGFCGATIDFGVGDVVNPYQVMDYSITKILSTFPNPDNFPPSKIKTLALDESFVSMICGDQWVGVKEYQEREEMFKQYNPLVFDMESFAIAQVASDLNIPTIVAKIVADNVQSDGSEQQYESAQEFIVNFDAAVYLLNDIVTNSL